MRIDWKSWAWKMRGRMWTTTAAACLALALSLSSGNAQDVLRVGLFPNITHAQALVASSMSRAGNGWFESRLGKPVRIEWLVYNAGPSAMEGLFTKAVDFTYVGPSPAVNAYARANSSVVRVISGAMRGGEALVVRGGIKTVGDLRGKTIATPQLGNTQDIACRAWLIEHGIKVTLIGGDARVIPTANPDILALFQQGKLDAAWTVEPWVTRLITEGGGTILFEPERPLTTILTTREDILANQPDLAARFAAAHRELTAWIRQNPDEAKKHVRDELSAITRKQIPAELVDTAWTRLHPDSAISTEPFQKFLEQAKLVGFLRATIDLSKLVEVPQ